MTANEGEILKNGINKITLITVIVTAIGILFLINYDVDRSFQEEGITLTDPKNVTNQTLQNVPAEDKDLSTGIEHNDG
ncbi:MAG TPA: hypothetical protein VK250_05235 [Nitrososphaeraceae archaeon]|nr:hypothetical protein [Nitrososphaeraceae archaeon]